MANSIEDQQELPAQYRRNWTVHLTGENPMRVDLEPEFASGEKRTLPIYSDKQVPKLTGSGFWISGRFRDTSAANAVIDFTFNVQQTKTYLTRMIGRLKFWGLRNTPVAINMTCIVPPMPPAPPSTPAPRRN